jgi:hypothetical protein
MYYTGDYYRGDYYRGDPGIFDVFKGVVKGAIGGFLTKGPIGALIGAGTGAVSTIPKGIRSATLAAGGSESAYTPAMKARHAEISARGGSGLLQRGGLAMQGGAPGMAMTAPGQFVRRMHWNRSTYITRGGGTSRWPVGLAVHPKGTEPVPSRRMNPANPRALRRAIHRMTGFGRIVKRMKRAIARASSAVGNVHRGRRAAVRRR